jgi:hypothetical protein
MIMRGALYICSFLSLLVIAILISGCTGLGQPAPTATPMPTATTKPTVAPPTYEISGTVRDYMGLPVYNAKVTLWSGDQVLDLANNPQYSSYGGDVPVGGYVFKHVPRGSYRIVAEKGGQQGSVNYPADGLTDIFIHDPTPYPSYAVTATPRPITNVYSVSFNIGRASSRDIIITNTGGETTHLQSVRISFTDYDGNIRGPDTSANLASSGVTGDLNKNVGSMCDIDGDIADDPTHVVVYGTFDDGTMQVLSSADV